MITSDLLYAFTHHPRPWKGEVLYLISELKRRNKRTLNKASPKFFPTTRACEFCTTLCHTRRGLTLWGSVGVLLGWSKIRVKTSTDLKYVFQLDTEDIKLHSGLNLNDSHISTVPNPGTGILHKGLPRALRLRIVWIRAIQAAELSLGTTELNSRPNTLRCSRNTTCIPDNRVYTIILFQILP